MTPERALEHDERCERRPHWFWGGIASCRCAERALARLVEELEKIIALRPQIEQVAKERDALRAENDRLTLAASESARTLQVEMAELQDRFVQAQASWHELDRAWRVRRDALKNQVTALREALDHARGVFAYYSKAFGYEACAGMVKKIDAALAALPQDGA